jgi:trans-aconitate methyltransferase
LAYRFDHAWKEERARLARIEETFDPWTLRAIEATRPQHGWCCLEIGGGGGSVAEWLCNRVGAKGRVVATDLETKFLEAIDAPNLEVRKHDIVSEALEQDYYDLVHARAVLDHLPQRDEIVPRLVDALKPHGWLVIESGDFSTVQMVEGSSAHAAFFRETFAKAVEVSRSFGAEMNYGRRLGEVFRDSGLESVAVEGYIIEWGAGHPLASLYDLTFQRLQVPILQSGALDAGDYNRLMELIRSPHLHAISHVVYSARGRRASSE